MELPSCRATPSGFCHLARELSEPSPCARDLEPFRDSGNTVMAFAKCAIMSPRPLIAIFVIGAVVSASIGNAHAQQAAPGAVPTEATPPAAGQYPPPNYPLS